MQTSLNVLKTSVMNKCSYLDFTSLNSNKDLMCLENVFYLANCLLSTFDTVGTMAGSRRAAVVFKE